MTKITEKEIDNMTVAGLKAYATTVEDELGVIIDRAAKKDELRAAIKEAVGLTKPIVKVVKNAPPKPGLSIKDNYMVLSNKYAPGRELIQIDGRNFTVPFNGSESDAREFMAGLKACGGEAYLVRETREVIE